MNQERADTAFESALQARDHEALAFEIRRRLDELTYGTNVSFRIAQGFAYSYRCISRGCGAVEHIVFSREAAEALIEAADQVGYCVRRDG